MVENELEELLKRTNEDAGAYRPRLFHLPADKPALTALLQANPSIRIHDRIHAQLRELVKSLNPAARLAPEALEEAVAHHVGNTPLAEYGTWVYYPWSGTLVHLLGAEEFGVVRTDRNRQKITREEQSLLGSKKVGVIGLSVGQSVSLTMALERTFGEIRMADFDTLDLSNLNRIRTGVRNLGANKAVITAREIAEIDPYLNVVCFTDGLTPGNMDAFFTDGGQLDILVEECDSVEIKILARKKAKELGVPVVMDMSDRGCLDVERFDLEPDRPLMHGWIDHLDLDAASRPMTAEEKVPYMLPITGVDTLSPRMKASVIELGQTISTWPQLATAVALGGALAGDAVRRIALDQFRASGRWFVDLEEAIADPTAPPPPAPPVPPPFHPAPEELETMDRSLGQPANTALKPDPAILEQLVQAGGLAPSQDNRQPWKFAWHGQRLLLLHDKDRSTSFWDPDHTGAHLALGACLENVVVQARACGLKTEVNVADDPSSPLVAGLAFHRHPNGMDPTIHWAEALATRRTHRSLLRSQPVDHAHLDRLARLVADGSPCHLKWVDTADGLQELAQLYGEAERLRLIHPEGHREYFGQVLRRPGQNGCPHDGIDMAELPLPPMAQAALQVMADPRAMDLLRAWGSGKALGMLPAIQVSGSAAVALLTLSTDTLLHRIAAGRALQRAWLEATTLGLGMQPLSAVLGLGKKLTHDPASFSLPDAEAIRRITARTRELFAIEDGTPLVLLRLTAPTHPSTIPARRFPPMDLVLAKPKQA